MRRDAVHERGAAAVEFAIVLPVLIAILCGTIDWGYYFFTREILVNAAREGARAGSLQYGADVDPQDEASDAALRYLEDTLDPDNATISTTARPDGGACPASSSCVRITYDTGGSATGFLGSVVPNSIVAYAEMRR